MKNVKFEYVFAVLIVIVLAFALGWAFVLKDKELIMPLLMALTGTLTAITAYMFTKSTPGQDKTPEPKALAGQLLTAPLTTYEAWSQPVQAPTQKPQPPPTEGADTVPTSTIDSKATDAPNDTAK